MPHLSTGFLPNSDCKKTYMGTYMHYHFSSHFPLKKKYIYIWKICCSTKQIVWVISPWKFSLVIGILGIVHLLCAIMQEYATFYLFPLSPYIIIPAAITSAWTCKWKTSVSLKSERITCVFHEALYTFMMLSCRTFLKIRNVQHDIIINVYRSSCKTPVILSDSGK